MTGHPFQRRRLVLVGDDDASGLIYFPTYFQYMSEAMQLLFAELGHPAADQIRSGASAPAVSACCDFVAPARAGEVLTETVRIRAGARSSFVHEHDFVAEDGTVVARGHVARCWVDLATLKPAPLPDWVRDAAGSH